MKRIVALVLMMILLCQSAFALVVEPEEYNTSFAEKTGIYAYDGYVLCDSLTLRAKPDINSKSLRSLKNGQKLLISMREGEWYHVDVTWDISHFHHHGVVSDRYFMRGDQFMSQTRKWDRSLFPAMPEDYVHPTVKAGSKIKRVLGKIFS